MEIQTAHVERCLETLEKALQLLNKSDADSIDYNMYRSACLKEFEIILEQAGKLLKKRLKPFFASPKDVDQLVFKDIFRFAAKHQLISLEDADRWLGYRDNRNSLAHDYGIGFAENTLKLLPQFVTDAKKVVDILKEETP